MQLSGTTDASHPQQQSLRRAPELAGKQRALVLQAVLAPAGLAAAGVRTGLVSTDEGRQALSARSRGGDAELRAQTWLEAAPQPVLLTSVLLQSVCRAGRQAADGLTACRSAVQHLMALRALQDLPSSRRPNDTSIRSRLNLQACESNKQ